MNPTTELLTHYQKFVRIIYWPLMIQENKSLDRKDIERRVPGIRTSGFVSHLLKGTKPFMEDNTSVKPRLLSATEYWKKKLMSLEEAEVAITKRVQSMNRSYYASKEGKSRKRRRKKKRQVVVIAQPVKLLAAIKGKTVNDQKAEAWDLLLSRPGVREAVLAEFKLKKFNWE